MRVRTYKGDIVTLKHFRYTPAHVELLQKIIYEVPNMRLEHERGVISAFELNIESQYHLRELNPLLSLAK